MVLLGHQVLQAGLLETGGQRNGKRHDREKSLKNTYIFCFNLAIIETFKRQAYYITTSGRGKSQVTSYRNNHETRVISYNHRNNKETRVIPYNHRNNKETRITIPYNDKQPRDKGNISQSQKEQRDKGNISQSQQEPKDKVNTLQSQKQQR